MKFLPAVLALAMLGMEVSACKHAGDACSNADYNAVKTQCECNSGVLLFCGHDVLKDHPVYEFFTNCKKPKDGGLQCVKGDCANCKGKLCQNNKRDFTPASFVELGDRIVAREPEALSLAESANWEA